MWLIVLPDAVVFGAVAAVFSALCIAIKTLYGDLAKKGTSTAAIIGALSKAVEDLTVEIRK